MEWRKISAGHYQVEGYSIRRQTTARCWLVEGPGGPTTCTTLAAAIIWVDRQLSIRGG